MSMTKTLVAIDTETTSKNAHKAELLYSNSYKLDSYEGFFFKSKGQLPIVFWEEFIDEYFIITQNGKYDAIVLSKYAVDLKIDFDTMIAQYLVAIDKSRKLEEMVYQYFRTKKKDLLEVYNETTGKGRKNLPDKWWEEIPKEKLEDYAKEDAEYTFKLYEVLDKRLKEMGLDDWFYNVEMPFTNILVKSELAGVKIDKEKLVSLKNSLEIKRNQLEHELKTIADNYELNLNSSKQLQEVLFDKLGLDKIRKTKSGYSTDSKTLLKLKYMHPFVEKLLEYREIEKILSTYTDSLLVSMDSNNRVHTTYNQALTSTRRLSSQNPNLQNIPSHSQIGKQIKECFVADLKSKFLILDYDQIELRLLAHFSEDEKLIKWFSEDLDIHQQTADLISKQLGREFTRQQGKTLNFSLIYGKTKFGFAKDWNCSEDEAERIIMAYFSQFPKVQKWIMKQQYEVLGSKGWTKSLAGLPLYCGNPFDDYKHVLRCAVNYPIQSSSQDILKKAIVSIYKKISLVPVLMVHDELVYELYDNGEGAFDRFRPPGVYAYSGGKDLHTEIVEGMENAWDLVVPLKVSWKISDKWEK